MPLLSPTQRAVLRTLGEDGISSQIVVPTNQVYTVFLSAPFNGNITGLQTDLTAGTLTADVSIDGVAVAGLSAIAVTVASVRTNPTFATATAVFQEGSLIEVTVSAVAGAADFAYVLFYTRPAK